MDCTCWGACSGLTRTKRPRAIFAWHCRSIQPCFQRSRSERHNGRRSKNSNHLHPQKNIYLPLTQALCSMGVVTAGEKHSFMASFSGVWITSTQPSPSHSPSRDHMLVLLNLFIFVVVAQDGFAVANPPATATASHSTRKGQGERASSWSRWSRGVPDSTYY